MHFDVIQSIIVSECKTAFYIAKQGGPNMNALERINLCGIVPVVVLDNAENACPTANALLAGGIDVMEITFRTAAAADAIKAVSQGCPNMLVGAGTVITLEQCKLAVEMGANFIVSPGFDSEVVEFTRKKI